MSQSQAPKLVSKLRYNLKPRRKISQPDGPKGRHDRIRKIVTALFKHERIECKYQEGDESRGYAERLLSDAIRYGDCHAPTMEMASYWLLEKQLIHKLFKVMVPKYRNYDISYTKMWKAPNVYPGYQSSNCVLEFRNNVYPPLGPDKTNHKYLIHNILLSEAKKFFDKEKVMLMQKKMDIDIKTTLLKQPAETVIPETSKDETLEASSAESDNSNVGETKEDSKGEIDQELQHGEETIESLDLDKMKIKEEELSSTEKEK